MAKTRKKEKITGPKALLYSLIEEKVETIFGYPGGAIMPIYNELYDIEDALVGKEGGKWVKYSSLDYINYANWISYGLLALGFKKGDKVKIEMKLRGREKKLRSFLSPLINYLERKAAICLCYSSVAKQYYQSIGIPESKIIIAVK